MASRFFYGDNSDSETSSSEEEDVHEQPGSEEESSDDEFDSDESDSSESDEEEARPGVSKFLHDGADSDESDEEGKVTVVKSAKDKRLEGLENTIRLIDNAEKINDWVVIATGEFFTIC